MFSAIPIWHSGCQPLCMGYPRRLYVPPDARGVYHCVSRCVRRAFLCGRDSTTGRSFEHRKQWVENRILELAGIFAVAVHAYAVMSNHFHLIVEINPIATRDWSDVDVAERWLRLSKRSETASADFESRVSALVAQPERIATLRKRLGNLSWFMRYLNEPIARRANAEDECTGRFWEGRFACQALLDDAAVLSGMVYVDLNPVRAGLTAVPEYGQHTSVRKRARNHRKKNDQMTPIAASIRSELIPIRTNQYLALVDWTGRKLHTGKKGSIPECVAPMLVRLNLKPVQWLVQVPATESRYWRAIGKTEALITRARESGLRWLRGIGTARALSRLAETT